MCSCSTEPPGADIFEGPRFASLHHRFQFQPRKHRVPRLPLEGSGRRFKLFAAAGYPVILRAPAGTVPNLAVLLERLVRRLGDDTLQVRTGSYDEPYTYAYAREYRTMSLRDYLPYLERPRASSPGYVGNHRISPRVARDLGAPLPRLTGTRRPDTPSLWLGGPGAVTPLHKDARDNFAIHLLGAKRWTLFPVRDAPLLGLRRPGPTDMAISLTRLHTPDLSLCPGFSQAVGLVEILRAGETLYVPEGWAHQVETLEPTLMVNYWMGELLLDGARTGPGRASRRGRWG